MFDIHIRDVPEHRVVLESARVAQAQLSDYLIGAMARVHRAADEFGGGAGTSALPYLGREGRAPVFFVTYHGNPNDGPVLIEVEAPVDTTAVAATVRPAHQEAFVRVRKDQVPWVGEAYEAVEAWVLAHGHAIAGPPREVYFTDFPTAEPLDAVFDVAFPLRTA